MSKFTNTTDGPLEVPLIGRVVQAGESFDVPSEYADAFKHQPAFGGKEFAPDALPVEPEKKPKAEAPSDATEEKK